MRNNFLKGNQGSGENYLNLNLLLLAGAQLLAILEALTDTSRRICQPSSPSVDTIEGSDLMMDVWGELILGEGGAGAGCSGGGEGSPLNNCFIAREKGIKEDKLESVERFCFLSKTIVFLRLLHFSGL